MRGKSHGVAPSWVFPLRSTREGVPVRFKFELLLSKLSRQRMSQWAMHINPAANLQELPPKTLRVESSTGANLREIPVTFKEELLRSPARPQRPVSPIFHRHHENRGPKPPLGDQFFRNIVLRSDVYLAFHLLPLGRIS